MARATAQIELGLGHDVDLPLVEGKHELAALLGRLEFWKPAAMMEWKPIAFRGGHTHARAVD